MVKHPFSMLQRYTRQKSRAHSSQAKKIGRGDLATRPIIVQDLWPGFQSDMLNFFYFTRKMLDVKLIKIKMDLLINYQGPKLGLANKNQRDNSSKYCCSCGNNRQDQKNQYSPGLPDKFQLFAPGYGTLALSALY
jgi:hypothetical protein